MMGKTIQEIVYITENGYSVLSAQLYVPVKFDGGIEVTDAPVSDGFAAVTLSGLPDDYTPDYEIEGLDFEIADGGVNFSGALPGSYTLVISDNGGTYAQLRAGFVLSTNLLPVRYNAQSNALEAADGVDASLVQAFLANISTVTVLSLIHI